jgi:hypothetical protein
MDLRGKYEAHNIFRRAGVIQHGARSKACGTRGERFSGDRIMKYTDDYNAKLEIWAKEDKVWRMPRIANLPRFGHMKFRSHREMNEWKEGLLAQLAATGGAKWTN